MCSHWPKIELLPPRPAAASVEAVDVVVFYHWFATGTIENGNNKNNDYNKGNSQALIGESHDFLNGSLNSNGQ